MITITRTTAVIEVLMLMAITTVTTDDLDTDTVVAATIITTPTITEAITMLKW